MLRKVVASKHRMQNHKDWPNYQFLSKFYITCSQNLITWPGHLMQFKKHLFLPDILGGVRLLSHVFIHLETTRLWN